MKIAFYHIVRIIEAGLFYKEETLGIFFDVEGAFDNTPFEVICSIVSEKRKSLPHHGGWYAVVFVRCFLQGKVRYPLLWSLVVGTLLWRPNVIGLYTQACSDDLAILCRCNRKCLQSLMAKVMLVNSVFWKHSVRPSSES